MSTAKKTGTAPKSGAQRKRNRKKKVQNSCIEDYTQTVNIGAESKPKKQDLHLHKEFLAAQANNDPCYCPDCSIVKVDIGTMTNDPVESREKVKAAREAKKLAKQQAKMKRDAALDIKQTAKAQAEVKNEDSPKELPKEVIKGDDSKEMGNKVADNPEQPKEIKGKLGPKTPKELPVEALSEDEVDRAASPIKTVVTVLRQIEPGKEQIKAERAAKKATKQAKKNDSASGDVSSVPPATITPKAGTEMTVTTPKAKVQGAQSSDTKLEADLPSDVKPKGSEEGGKSKAELRAERRAKQEAQRAAKEAAQAKTVDVKPKEPNSQPSKEVSKTVIKEKSPKPKTLKQTAKPQGHKVSWFRHLYNDDDKAKLNKIPINSNLHPAIIKLGVQLATRVVTGSNARCIALLDALKKMVRDYSLPAKTEFGRGLDAHLATSLEFLWSMRQPTASQTNAVKFFRHHLTQLPNNVDEFDAKKTLQEEIDRYIREQIDMAGEAISIAVRNKICEGDNILTYGCSSLIERILVDAHCAGVEFRAVVCGGGVATRAAREMTRRLTARGVPCICVDITALSFVMRTVNKVVLGCSSLLANGSVLGAAGTAAVALAARAFNTPVLVACETHKFSERVQTDAFVYNEIGDPDELIDKSDENSPLKDWRSNPNLTPLNLTYDVTPPNLVTAVVTELAILPCTSAPVVLRFKLSEYSI